METIMVGLFLALTVSIATIISVAIAAKTVRDFVRERSVSGDDCVVMVILWCYIFFVAGWIR